MHQPQHIYNDLNTSLSLEGMDMSYNSDTAFNIYSELQYSLQQSSNTPAINIQNNNIAANPTTGIIYGFRTRHLSCIEENDSDSLHSTSVPKPAFEMIQDVDEKFKKLVSEEVNTSITSWPDAGEDEVDHMVMIDESRLYDMDYLEQLSASQVVTKDVEEEEQFGVNVSEVLWQSTVSEPAHRSRFNGGRSHIPDIMTTSCYGALNTSFGSEISGPPMEQSTPTKQSAQNKIEPIYATPDKRRECNRSFDSSCPSQSSSFYGDSMTSSLDLKCMSTSGCGAISFGLTRPANNNPMEMLNISMDNSKTEWNSTGDSGAIFGIISPAEEVSDETTMQCITAAENDLQSIRRLLEHDTSGSICPSCRISFDKGKRRKLIDNCGHERCYSCMFRNDQCPMCMNNSLKDVDCSNAQGYDTGIGGSTSTIVSPLGSPQPQLRSQVQRTNAAALARYMQHNRQQSISPEYHRYGSIGKLPRAFSTVATNSKNSINNNNHAAGTSPSSSTKAVLEQHSDTADLQNNNGISHGSHNNGISSSSSILSNNRYIHNNNNNSGGNNHTIATTHYCSDMIVVVYSLIRTAANFFKLAINENIYISAV